MITYARDKKDSTGKTWLLRGPAHELQPGASVTVTRANGETKPETVGEVLWSGADASGEVFALATIARTASVPVPSASPGPVDVIARLERIEKFLAKQGFVAKDDIPF